MRDQSRTSVRETYETGASIFPASLGQQRLWFLDQLDPGSPVYNIPSAARIESRLEVDAFERSLNVFAFDSTPRRAGRKPGLHLSWMDLERDVARADLAAPVRPGRNTRTGCTANGLSARTKITL